MQVQLNYNQFYLRRLTSTSNSIIFLWILVGWQVQSSRRDEEEASTVQEDEIVITIIINTERR